MSKFQGYAQESRKGFNPINLTDKSRKILERADQTIRGMQAVRDADVANTSAYIRSFQDAMAQERQSQSEYNRLLNLNDQTRIDAAKARALENAQRKQQLGERRERIYKALANFSTTAIKAVGQYQEQKFDEEYNETLQRLYTQGFADPEDSAAYLADKQTGHNLNIIGVSQQATAAAAEANGTSSMEAAELRANDYGLSTAKKKALAVYHASQWPVYLQNAFSSDNETQVKIYGPNGKLVDGTPMQAKGSKNQSIVANQLLEKFLRQTGLWGMKESFLTEPLMKMRAGANTIIAATMRQELALQQQEQFNTVLFNFQSEVEDGNAANAFHNAYNRIQFMVPGQQKEARQKLFEAMKEPRRIVNGMYVGFTSDQITEIFQSPFMDQPLSIGERFSEEMIEVMDARQSKENAIEQANQTADRLAVEKDLDNLVNLVVGDIKEDSTGTIDLTEENLEQMVAQYRALGPDYNGHVDFLQSLTQYTEQAVQEKEHIERIEEAIEFGQITAKEIMQNTNLSFETRQKLAREAAKTDGTKMSNDHEREALNHVTSALKDRARVSAAKTTHRSVRITIQYALRQWKKAYSNARRNSDATEEDAYQIALQQFEKEYEKGNDGFYALVGYEQLVEDAKNNKLSESGAFKYFKDMLPNKVSTKEITATNLKKTIDDDPTAIDRPITAIRPLKKVIQQIGSGLKPGIVPQVEILRRIAPKKEDGTRYSYAELLVKQLEAHGLKPPLSVQSAIELESQVPARYQRYTQYPTPTNTDIVVIASGGNAVYNRNYKITATQIQALDVLAKYESAAYARNGDGGYNAMNQGGKDKGRTAINPGHSKDILGENLTDLTVGAIIELQKQGDLHAAGRYQFVGNTLPGVVKDAGVPLTDKFNQRTQDYLGLVLMQQRGIGPWVGPNDKATSAERELIERARQQPLSFGEGVWRQSQNVNPLLRERLTTGN